MQRKPLFGFAPTCLNQIKTKTKQKAAATKKKQKNRPYQHTINIFLN